MLNLNVLIVEDEIIIANDIKNLLTDWGYCVTACCATGEDALLAFKQQIPDIALIDVQLVGKMDGVDTARAFNALQPIPFIYVTAQADFMTVERAKQTAPSAYLLKPFDERNLHISMQLALSNFTQNIDEESTSNAVSPSSNSVKLTADTILKKGNMLFLKQNYRFIKLDISDIIYIEADKNHCTLVLKQQKIVLRLALSALVERLGNEAILRVHRSFAVNMQWIEEFDDNEIVIKGKSIPLTSGYKEDFLNKFIVL